MDHEELKQTQNSQFISFHDFSSISRSGGDGQAQLDHDLLDHQQFGNLVNKPTGLDTEDLQGFRQQNEGDTK